jgi:hypothetical protein
MNNFEIFIIGLLAYLVGIIKGFILGYGGKEMFKEFWEKHICSWNPYEKKNF